MARESGARSDRAKSVHRSFFIPDLRSPTGGTMEATSKRSLTVLGISVVLIALTAVALSSCMSFMYMAAWSAAQWTLIPSLRNNLQQAAWQYWQDTNTPKTFAPKEIPVVRVQDHLDDILLYLERLYGKDWRKRPLLLKGLWNPKDLKRSDRRLSLAGLLQENLTIPYFTDARQENALTPDSQASVKQIVANISKGQPHKIGSQLVIQSYPELVEEVAPVDIVTKLFGNYFTPGSVKGTGPFNLLPALTTVPLFVANGQKISRKGEAQPYTALHCEPIGNVAVQLSGEKQWTLVQPEFSFLLKPSTSPDGRAFFASWASDYSNNVPTYTVTTAAGDAIWVPTWTWHRVDYVASKDMAIGASLFHFRPIDYVRNNPLFAILMIPAVLLELIGYNTQ